MNQIDVPASAATCAPCYTSIYDRSTRLVVTPDQSSSHLPYSSGMDTSGYRPTKARPLTPPSQFLCALRRPDSSQPFRGGGHLQSLRTVTSNFTPGFESQSDESSKTRPQEMTYGDDDDKRRQRDEAKAAERQRVAMTTAADAATEDEYSRRSNCAPVGQGISAIQLWSCAWDYEPGTVNTVTNLKDRYNRRRHLYRQQQHHHLRQQQQQHHVLPGRASVADGGEVRECVGCGASSSKVVAWRKDSFGHFVCLSCETHLKRSPTQKSATTIRQQAKKSSRRSGLLCANCSSAASTLWRRNNEGETVCNACGLYYKLHGINRPITMRKDGIQTRKRRPKGPKAASNEINQELHSAPTTSSLEVSSDRSDHVNSAKSCSPKHSDKETRQQRQQDKVSPLPHPPFPPHPKYLLKDVRASDKVRHLPGSIPPYPSHCRSLSVSGPHSRSHPLAMDGQNLEMRAHGRYRVYENQNFLKVQDLPNNKDFPNSHDFLKNYDIQNGSDVPSSVELSSSRDFQKSREFIKTVVSDPPPPSGLQHIVTFEPPYGSRVQHQHESSSDSERTTTYSIHHTTVAGPMYGVASGPYANDQGQYEDRSSNTCYNYLTDFNCYSFANFSPCSPVYQM